MKNPTAMRRKIQSGYVLVEALVSVLLFSLGRTNLSSYVGTTTLASLPAGQQVVAVNNSVVTITVTWRPPGLTADRQYVTMATLGAN